MHNHNKELKLIWIISTTMYFSLAPLFSLKIHLLTLNCSLMWSCTHDCSQLNYLLKSKFIALQDVVFYITMMKQHCLWAVLQNALISHTLTSLHLLHWHHARDLLGSLLEERTAATPAPLYLEHLDTPPLCTLQQHPPVLLTGTNMEGHIGMTIPTGVLDSLQSQLLP